MSKHFQLLDRLPPHSLEAEQAALGCCLMDPKECLPTLIEKLKAPGAFYDVRHQNLAGHLFDMFARNLPIDIITLSARLMVGDKLQEVGGLEYVSSLMDKVAAVTLLDSYVKIVRETYIARRMIRVCTDATARLMDGAAELPVVFDSVERDVLEVNQERVESVDADWRSVVQRSIDQMEEYHRGHAQMRGLATGFDYLDKMCCGMAPGQMIVLAGRPGTGKTSMGFNIVEHVAVNKKIPVGVFSLEMTGEELAMRSIFQKGEADFQRYRTGFLKNEDIPKLVNAAAAVAMAPVYLDEQGDSSIMEIRAKARRWHTQYGIKMVVIDYLQLVRGSDRYRERKDEVAEVSAGVKSMAKELKIPVVVLAQLNRELEKERNRIPRMSDLRDCGNIEQDADVIWMLYEPKLDDAEQELVDNRTDWASYAKRVNVQVVKQRNGPTGAAEFLFWKASMKFKSYKNPRRKHAPADQEE